jgi:biopolymer transport protein ExbB
MKNQLQPLLGWLMICLVIVAVGSAIAPQTYGQEDDADADADAPAEKKAGAAKAGEAAPAAAPVEENFLWWVAKTSGPIGAVLLALSIYFVATVARMFMELRPEILTPLDVLEDCEKFLQARDFTGLYKRLKADNSYFSTVVSSGIAELPNGIPEARDAMERVGEVNTINLERKISMLAVLGTLGPMIGLLGTLQGMIGAFGTIARSGTELKAGDVAKNISEALLLTFEGVLLSTPAIYFFALFRNRISSYSASVMLDADAFMRRLYSAMKSKSTAAPAASGPAAPVARP